MKEIVAYKSSTGKCPYDEWFYKLDKTVQARIEKRLERVEEGNFGDCKKLDENISELRFKFGAGYRIYFAESNNVIIILLCAGDKSSQTEDIKKAKRYLEDLIERTK